MGALLYLPETWTSDPARRAAARIPGAVVFQEKWRLALTLVRRDAGGRRDADRRRRRRRIRRQPHGPPDAASAAPAVCVGDLADADGVPRHAHAARRSRRNRRRAIAATGWPDQEPVSVRALSDALPARAWRRVAWRNGTNPPWEADFAARQKRTTSPERWSTADISPGLRLSFKRFSRACFSSVGPDTCTG